MFGQWMVAALIFLTGIMSFLPSLAPVNLVSALMFGFFVFLWLNRRPSRFNYDFWRQFLATAQLFQVVYMLRFLMVELVYRELGDFISFLYPKVEKFAFVKKWESEDSCMLKAVNLALLVYFIALNLGAVYVLELVGGYAWDTMKAHYYGELRSSSTDEVSIGRTQSQKTVNCRMREPDLSTPRTRHLLRFWPGSSRVKNVHPANNSVAASSVCEPQGKTRRGGRSPPENNGRKTTRSGRNV